MTTLKEMAEEYEHDHVGIKAVHVRQAYLAGVRAALNLACVQFPPTAQRFSGYDIQTRIHALIPTE